MSKSTQKIANVKALNKREDPHGNEAPDLDDRRIPRRWAGIVTAGPTVNHRGDLRSGEWNVVIEPLLLEKAVTATVNAKRTKGTKVQFCLNGDDRTGTKAATTWFETKLQAGSTVYEKNPEWRQGMF